MEVRALDLRLSVQYSASRRSKCDHKQVLRKNVKLHLRDERTNGRPDKETRLSVLSVASILWGKLKGDG